MWPMSPRPAVARPRIVLASASPRRRDLLASVGVHAEVVSCDIDETPLAGESAQDLVARLACGKAEAGANRIELELGSSEHSADVPAKVNTGERGTAFACLVIGSDTVVEIDGDILGKPVDDDDALAMLRRLSGRTHRAHTGVSVIGLSLGSNSEIGVAVATTAVTMRDLSEEDLAWYLSTGDHRGKAGSYGIQGFAAPFVSGIEGPYDAVVGLPLHMVDQMTTSFGWPLRTFCDLGGNDSSAPDSEVG